MIFKTSNLKEISPRIGGIQSQSVGDDVSSTPAYKFIDHMFDVVVVGAEGAGSRATQGSRGGLNDCLHYKGLPTRGRVDLAQNSEPKREALKMLHARPDCFHAAWIITEFACHVCRASSTWHATCLCSHLVDEARHESYVIMPNLHSQMRRHSLCRSHLAPKVRSLRFPPTRSLIGFRPPFPIADQAPRLPRDENTSKHE